MSSRPIRAEELSALRSKGRLERLTSSEHVIALDGVAVVVHPDLAIEALTVAELRAVFAGQIRNWRTLGGGDQAVVLHARGDRSGTYDTFKSLVLRDNTLSDKAIRYESNALLSDTVAQQPGSIGFTGLPYIRNAKALAIRDGDAQALMPKPFNVAVEDYALARRLYFYLPDQDEIGLARSFVHFALSGQGQSSVEDIGFVPLSIQRQVWAVPKDAPEQYLRLIADAQRLSTTFRFDEGESRLDSRSQRDLQRLLEWWQMSADDYQLMLFGFSDATESAPFLASHLALSRADDVAQELLRAGVAPAKVRGFGAKLPISSNADASGRRKNRRVEVWIKPREPAATSAAATAFGSQTSGISSR
jgi:phosphate transport system substrate-binding protein